MTAAGIYVRISRDYSGEALGVQRQEEDCRKLALASGADGLDHYRGLYKRLARWKRAPDLLALEAEPGQFEELARMTRALMPEARVEILNDLHGDERVLIASKRKRP